MKFKRFVVLQAEKNSISIAKEFGIDEKRVREWSLQKTWCKDGKSKRNRLSGGGKKEYSKEEEIIAQRILRLREMHLRVMRKDIGKIAKKEIRNPLFRASPGWISHRRGFVTRMKTTV